ncbi:hypothetical protein [Streptomyces aureoversilis]|uniref:Uncharacterized protein n=1 Tax=Streptomyces aureoversilis TaxID=67277 RepID=A0ABV9ZV68_9ACTN
MSGWVRAGRAGIVAFAAVMATTGAAGPVPGDDPGTGGPVRAGGERPVPGPAAGALRGVPRIRPGSATVTYDPGSDGVPGRHGLPVPDGVPGRSHGHGSVRAGTGGPGGDAAAAEIDHRPGCLKVGARGGAAFAAIVIGCERAPRPVTPAAPRPPAPAPAPPEYVPPPPPRPAPARLRAPAPRPALPPAPAPRPPAAPRSEPPPAPEVPPAPSHIVPRAYHASVSPPPEGGASLVTLTLLLTTPAVLAAAMLRPRGGGGGGGRRS